MLQTIRLNTKSKYDIWRRGWDGKMKAKAKLYADKKRHAECLDLSHGDKVLVKQEKQNKLSTPFAPQPYDGVTKGGNSVITESPEGVQLMRNTTHVKKYEESSLVLDNITSLPVETTSADCEAEQVKTNSPNLARPARVKKLPQKRKDVVLA